jgi:hypothetical protein
MTNSRVMNEKMSKNNKKERKVNPFHNRGKISQRYLYTAHSVIYQKKAFENSNKKLILFLKNTEGISVWNFFNIPQMIM